MKTLGVFVWGAIFDFLCCWIKFYFGRIALFCYCYLFETGSPYIVLSVQKLMLALNSDLLKLG